MAIDTQQKRWGTLSDGPPLPSGSLDKLDRYLLVDLFGVAGFLSLQESVAGSLPAMAGALTRKLTAKRSVTGAI